MKDRNKIATLLYQKRARSSQALAVLLDPDKVNIETLPHFLEQAVRNNVDFFFIGGSLITEYRTGLLITQIRKFTEIPTVLFPGNCLHIEPLADAILLLSLISGRNPELLIGQHVTAAPLLKRANLEILPTGYMLVESGRQTTVSYISNTLPIPSDKPEIAACTAMAGEMLGLQYMFLDAGSGALRPVPGEMIQAVRKATDVPLIVGGGIDTVEKAQMALEAGADMIVIGNALEKNPDFLTEVSLAVKNKGTRGETSPSVVHDPHQTEWGVIAES